MAENAVCKVRADVMLYDSQHQKWVPCAGHGTSFVHIYQSLENQTFRVVGRKAEGGDVTVNCGIIRGLIYNEATARFHQWRSNGQVYGLNFASTDESSDFAQWMKTAIAMVQGDIPWPSAQPVQAPPPALRPTGPRPMRPGPPGPPGPRPPGPPMGGPPRPPGPPSGGPPPPGPPSGGPPPPPGPPAGGPPMGGPPPPGPAGVKKTAGGGGGGGRGALLAAIQGGTGLRKVGPPKEKAGPGTVVGDGAPKPEVKEEREAPKMGGPFGGGGNDFMSQLKARQNRMRQNKGDDSASSSTGPSKAPAARPPNFNTLPKKVTPAAAPASSSPPTATTNQNAAVSHNEVQQFIREEIEKMKLSLLSEFRKIIREEIQNSNL